MGVSTCDFAEYDCAQCDFFVWVCCLSRLEALLWAAISSAPQLHLNNYESLVWQPQPC